MGLFDRDKMNKEAGEWAAIAMACVLFADGSASDAEVAAAKGQAVSNPVLKNSIGSKRAEELFDETARAVAQIPSAMLPTYDVKLQSLAEKIDDANEKNFALATAIAVAMGDRSLSEGEHTMLLHFKEMLGATIQVPSLGKAVSPEVRMAADAHPAVTAESKPVEKPEAKEAAAVNCPNCNKPTTFYPGYGHWCAACQQYATAEAKGAASEKAEADKAKAAAEPAKPAAKAVICPSCGKETQFYEGYGHWCLACQKYASR